MVHNSSLIDSIDEGANDIYCNNNGDCITARFDCKVFEVYRSCPHEHNKDRETLFGLTILELILLFILLISIIVGLVRDRD